MSELSEKMLAALAEANASGIITAWEFSSSVIGALKKRGMISLDPTAAANGFRGTYYVITDAGRAALRGKP